MAAQKKEFLLEFGGKDTGAGSTADSLVKKLRALKAEARASGEKDIQKLIKGGPEKILEFGGKLVGGAQFGLAAFITTQVLGQLNSLVAKAKELKQQYQEGKISAGEMADELLGEIPLLGEAWKLGRGIKSLWEVVDHTQEEINRKIEARNRLLETQLEVAKHINQVLKEQGKDRAGRNLALSDDARLQAKQPLEEAHREKMKELAKLEEEANSFKGEARQKRLNEIYGAKYAEERTYANELLHLRIHAAHEKEEAEKHANQEMLDAQAEVDAELLKQYGKTTEAQIVLLKRRNDAEKVAIEERAYGDIGKGADRNQRMGQADKEKQLADQRTRLQISELLYQDQIERRDKQFSADKELRTQQLAEMEEKAVTSTEAKRQAIKLRMQLETDEKILAFQKIAENRTLDESTKAQARQAIERLKADEQKREKAVDAATLALNRRGVEGLQLDTGFTGLADRYRAGQDPILQEARKTAGNTVHLKDMAANIKTMADTLKGVFVTTGRAVNK